MSEKHASVKRTLCVTLLYEYEVDPAYYPHGGDPYAMAMLDVEQDPATVFDAAEWRIVRAVFK